MIKKINFLSLQAGSNKAISNITKRQLRALRGVSPEQSMVTHNKNDYIKSKTFLLDFAGFFLLFLVPDSLVNSSSDL